MDYNWLTPKAEAMLMGDKGWGSVAIEPISAGELLTAFGGWVVTRAVLDRMSTDRRARSIQIEEDLYLVSDETPEPGDMINHSCDPTGGLLGANLLLARRDIAVGEEITFDYAMSDSSDYDEFRCECGTALCRGAVTGEDWRRSELQERYAGWFSPYLARKIARLSVS